MKEIKLLQIIPELNSGGAEQGTVDVANYIASKDLHSYIISNGGKMLQNLNRKNITHYKMPIQSKNIFTMYKNSIKIKKIIDDNKINIVHLRSRIPAWVVSFISKKKI